MKRPSLIVAGKSSRQLASVTTATKYRPKQLLQDLLNTNMNWVMKARKVDPPNMTKWMYGWLKYIEMNEKDQD
jgi:hypothetical protein